MGKSLRKKQDLLSRFAPRIKIRIRGANPDLGRDPKLLSDSIDFNDSTASRLSAIFLTFCPLPNRLEVSEQAGILYGSTQFVGLSTGLFMFLRLCSAVVLGFLFLLPASAQTIRFDTNVGAIDFLLNPTNNSNLQPHVENILTYVNSGRYDLSVINRAADGFVLQFGGFTLDPLVLPDSFGAFTNIPSFDPVIVDADNDGTVDFDVTSLLNTRGTVSLALSANANTGTSSFFVNLGANPSLDAANMRFVPFAQVVDMATVDLILSLPQTNFAGGGLAGDDVPTLNGTGVVFIERAFVLEAEGSTTAITFSTRTRQDTAGDTTEITFSTLTADSDAGGSTPVTLSDLTPAGDSSGSAPVTFSTVTPIAQAVSSAASASIGATAAVQSFAVPEPSALVLAVGALMVILVMKPSKKR